MSGHQMKVHSLLSTMTSRLPVNNEYVLVYSQNATLATGAKT